ncbi:hypothetical protein SAMN05444161_8712 [Rhizobiales bacterium GAS191]|nr:hypothetical protein SAMN05519103_08924 [Rhizobiales bacterium GAS113]SEF12212.1 hypothetical protein SAMN05444161_8712 [Rhizobiales bacterium GAS191]
MSIAPMMPVVALSRYCRANYRASSGTYDRAHWPADNCAGSGTRDRAAYRIFASRCARCKT